MLEKFVSQNFPEFVNIGDHFFLAVEPFIRQQMKLVNGRHKANLLRLIGGRHSDPAILGNREIVEQLTQRRIVLRILVEQGFVHETVGKQKEKASIHHGEVDMLALAGLFPR